MNSPGSGAEACTDMQDQEDSLDMQIMFEGGLEAHVL